VSVSPYDVALCGPKYTYIFGDLREAICCIVPSDLHWQVQDGAKPAVFLFRLQEMEGAVSCESVAPAHSG